MGPLLMKDQDQNPLADILHRLTARYLTVRPEGFIIPKRKSALCEADARILAYGAARTLYRNRKPDLNEISQE